ncbi:MAG TPA: methyltransferase domain-containing protein [Burkholderiaceae bacterium]|nr:methyltransferase domain-containing protein [Burkholderiaceae bacterium]
MTMPGYKTKLESIAIAGVDDLVIRSLLDRQQFHDPCGAAQRRGISSATWPLFGLLWPSGVQLAIQLALRPVCRNERILEIGCGLGLASLVGQRRGARVTASDCHPLTEKFLDENARLNELPLLDYRYGQWGAGSMPSGPGASESALRGRYDLIIGSDLLYERDAPRSLAEFIDRHAADKAEIWMVDPNRGHRPAFNRHMAAHGFRMQRDQRLPDPAPASHGGDAKLDAYKGRLLVYRRGGPLSG